MMDHRTRRDATELQSIHPLETATKCVHPSRRRQCNPTVNFMVELDKMDSSSSRVFAFFMVINPLVTEVFQFGSKHWVDITHPQRNAANMAKNKRRLMQADR